jgi:hypothetical protein
LVDYRLKENRREAFIRWYAWSLKYKDCDPAVWATNYLNQRYQHNDEQRLWFCWLYGNTYYLPTAWVLMNEFPDFELATVSRIEQWNTENYKRLRYQTDTKWNKGHLSAMFESYQKFIGNCTQRERLESFYGNTPEQSFNNLWDGIKSNLHKFGRYSTWFYLQHLRHTGQIDIEPDNLMLNDYSGSRSHRNGLLLALGRDDEVDTPLTADQYKSLELEARDILNEIQNRFPDLNADNFQLETVLCSFKKIFRVKHGRYLRYYLDRQAEEIQQLEQDNWLGIDWQVLWDSRTETLIPELNLKTGIDKSLFDSFLITGNIKSLNMMFDNPEIKSNNNLLEFI